MDCSVLFRRSRVRRVLVGTRFRFQPWHSCCHDLDIRAGYIRLYGIPQRRCHNNKNLKWSDYIKKLVPSMLIRSHHSASLWLKYISLIFSLLFLVGTRHFWWPCQDSVAGGAYDSPGKLPSPSND